MSHKKLVFNGISSEGKGIVIQTPPVYEFPERDITTTHIPGRNGDIITDNKCYKNIKRTYSIAKAFPNYYNGIKGFMPNAQNTLEWFTEPKGKYVRLEDDYDPDVYRLATFYSSGSFNNLFDQGLSINVTFDCKPQRYLKAGEEPIVFNSPNLYITNPTHYEAKPKIKIENIGEQSDRSKILMLTTLDEQKNVVSNVTLTDVGTNETVYLDSETQDCYNETGPINEKVGLNGKDFPTLKANTSNITLDKYNKNEGIVTNYNTQISESDNYEVVKSEYMPYETIEAENESKIMVKSYESLIKGLSKTYSAASYQSMVGEVCDRGLYDSDGNIIADKYTIPSFNNALKQAGTTISIDAPIKDLPDILPDWLYYDELTSSTIGLYDHHTDDEVGGFYSVGSSKEINYIETEGLIGEFKMENGVVHIELTMYEAYTTPEYNHILAIDKEINDEMPSWLRMKIAYSDSRNPVRIDFVLAEQGYVWKDKTWILGKPTWTFTDSDTTLVSYTWNSLQKAFMPEKALTLSANTVFTYRWLKNFIQYDVPKGQTNLLKVVGVNVSLTQITFAASRYGYYRTILNDKKETTSLWSEKDEDDQILKVDGTTSFTVEYINTDIPTYSKEKDWPTWLSATPENTTSGILLNASHIKFKVLKNGYYRVSYTEETDNDTMSEWTYLETGNTLIWKKTEEETPIPLSQPTDEAIYVSYIEEIPDEYQHDRAFEYEGERTDTSPGWLDFDIYMEAQFDNEGEKTIRCHRYYTGDTSKDDPDNDLYCWSYTVGSNDPVQFYVKGASWAPTVDADLYDLEDPELTIGKVTKAPVILYSAREVGYFKWDTNTSWVHKNAGDEILVSEYKDDSTFSYCSKFIEPKVPEILNGAVTVTKEISSSGDPVSLHIYADRSGYFRVNTNPNWTYYELGDRIFTASVGQDTRINYLVKDESDDSLQNVKITITPNWWML